MKIILFPLLFVFVLNVSAIADPADDLSQKSDAQITKVAQQEAKAFYAQHKAAMPNELSMMSYVEGRTIKHNLTDSMKGMYYTNSFNEVLEQLNIDGE